MRFTRRESYRAPEPRHNAAELTVLVRERVERESPARRLLLSRVPAWAKVSLLVLCAVELSLVGALRVASGLADLHAVQEIGPDLSTGTASAACTEGLAAVDDLWPAVPLLYVG